MPTFQTNRQDIQVESAPGTDGPLIRMVTLGRYGDETVKVLAQDEAIDLARALLTAAEMPSPYAF